MINEVEDKDDNPPMETKEKNLDISIEEQISRLETNELLISYIKGEDTCHIWMKEEEPLTEEFDLIESKVYGPKIGRITKPLHMQKAMLIVQKAILIVQKANKEEPPKPLTELIPKEYHSYLDIFEKKKAERFPEPRPYGHAINLKPDSQPKDFKLSFLS
ncbi:hypothetical protein QCA50_001193 [Cerrena zonata]|uniref:Uncharacterized protein n=1 Tax=Cerrena zonata TaxID=2478898 RepID=A0AAW0H0I7_9APHY